MNSNHTIVDVVAFLNVYLIEQYVNNKLSDATFLIKSKKLSLDKKTNLHGFLDVCG